MSGIFDQIINYSPPLIVSGTVNYKGTWDASTNNPTLNSSPAASTKGDYYVVSTAGTQFGITFAIGDWIISNGTAWEKVDLTDAVSSVFGRTGAVVGVSTDYSAVGITNTAIGASNPSTGAFTTVSASTPIAVTSGGTGVTTSTGTTNVVLSNSPTIVTPVIAQINDASGNETLKLASIASAVNEVTIENAATGNAVHISATGGDASVGLHLAGKGASGYVNVQDSVDATKRIMFNAAGGTTNTRTMLSSTQTVDRTISLPDATGTLLYGGGPLGTPSSGTVTNLTGTASININGTVGATTANTGAFTTLSASGNLTFTGTANRITGDFSNATVANRVSFQSSTTNGNTVIQVLPNGTASISTLDVFNNSDPTNATALRLFSSSTEVSLRSQISGTGTPLPLTFTTGATERMRIDTAGNVGIGMTPTYAFDLTVGAGNGIRLNASSGQCNMFFQQAGVTNGYINAAGGAGTDLNIYATRLLNLVGGTSGISMVGNTAVTGALSSTGAISSTLTGNDITPLSLLDSTLANGNFTQILLGKAANSNECAVIKFTQNATTSVLGFQMFGDGSPGLTISKGASGIAAITSTGLAVTGSISATYAYPATGQTMTSNSTSTHSAMIFNNPNGAVGSINTAGSVCTFNSLSDYRRKSNVQDLTGSGSFIDALKPRTFDWDTGDKGVGFIAHEFAEVSPSSVTGEKDAVDEEGKPIYQAMQASSAEVIANLVAQIQELRQRVAGLETK
jgi:hypothetical protein